MSENPLEADDAPGTPLAATKFQFVLKSMPLRCPWKLLFLRPLPPCETDPMTLSPPNSPRPDEESASKGDTLSPNVIVKGSEWTADEVRERDNIPENVQIKVYPLVGDYSTTNTMHKIRDMETCEKI